MHDNSENITNIFERLSQFLDYKGESFNKLASQIGVSNSYFSKMVKNKGSIGSDIIQKIVIYYENLNIEWLVIGRGSMLKSEDEIASQKMREAEERLHKTSSADLIMLIREKDSQLREQAEEIGRLKEQLSVLRKNIPYQRMGAEE